MGEFIKNNLPDPLSYFETEGLELVGRGKWRTIECSFHGSSDSMRINTAKALGAWQEDGKPGKQHRPRPLPAIEAIRVLAFESTLIAVAGGNIAHSVILTDNDRARVLVAAKRITKIQELFA